MDGNKTITAVFVVLLPDLLVESVTHRPEDPTTVDPITFTVVVRNAGGPAGIATVLRVLLDGGAASGDFAVPPLEAGGSVTNSWAVGPVSPQEHVSTATVDVNGVVTELDEENNVQQHSFTVTPPFFAPLSPEIVLDNIKAAVEGRTVQPNYERSLAPEPADQEGHFAYLPDPAAEAMTPPGFFSGWNKGREVEFMLTLLETPGDSLRAVEFVFQRYAPDPGFPATNDLQRYDVDYVLSLTYARGNPPVERIDSYAASETLA